jgi:predicted nucleic acid-binding protein
MSAAANVSIDTNVLVYAHDTREPVKGPRAARLLTQILTAGRPLLSIQVLSEFFWAATRKIGTAHHGLALWDAQSLAVAVLHNAAHLLSEGFAHRRTIEGVTCLNPFAADFDPAEILPP